ncbi:hypothetical protein BURPS1710b_0356 [Burkholderia pseudomallei 1710b]|uniref:Uncharacterized protein n=1 Tax=Burkholderia pseudomallei (strain 1710b) TaxID=320372 RepID=Q3JXD4_BURP1|nr:hypothetical protein BURPS1710b_0356 [Burkholderia pseudomallei 1710b]
MNEASGSGNVQVLVRLHRQPPPRMTLAPIDREPGVELARRAVHRLHEEMLEVELRVIGKALVVLRHHHLQFVALRDDERRIRLRAHADPVDRFEHGQRAVRLDRDREARRVQRVDERLIELQHRLAARADDEAIRLARRPERRDPRRERSGILELAAVLAVGADEVGIAEAAHRAVAVRFAPRPEVAAGEPAEHGRTAGVRALALQRIENFLDRVRHAASFRLAPLAFRCSMNLVAARATRVRRASRASGGRLRHAFAAQIGVIAALAQLACRAFATAEAPVMQLRALADIARVRLDADQLDERRAAQLLGEPPRIGLVEPHQRRFQHEARVHAEIERDLQRLHRVVAAVRIAGEIGLAHAADERAQPAPISDRRGDRHEQQVAARHERVRQAVRRRLDLDRARHRGIADRAEHRQIDQVIVAQLVRPLRKTPLQRIAHALATFELDAVALAVIEAERLDGLIALERPGHTCGRILAAGKQYERAVLSVCPNHRDTP